MTSNDPKPVNEITEASVPEQSPDDQLEPKPGEFGIPDVAAAQKAPRSKTGLLAIALLAISLIAAGVVTAQRVAASIRQPKADATLVRDRPMAAGADLHKLDMTPAAPTEPNPTGAASAPRIPAIEPTSDELGEPIGVRRTGDAGPPAGGQRSTRPEDAPTLLVSTRPGTIPAQAVNRRIGADAAGTAAASEQTSDPNGAAESPLDATSRNLQGYQRQLQGLLDQLTRTTTAATGQAQEQAPSRPPSSSSILGSGSAGRPPADAGLFGGQLQGASTARVQASMIGDRALIMPKGTSFACALKTKIISAASGLVGCEVLHNVYSEDRVLLVERGSHLDGEYRVTSVRPGTVRIPVLWSRLRTPLGVTIELDSPGTGQLGESGIDGYVDNRWGERIGAAMLLSLIDDSVKLVILNQANEQQGNTVVLPSTTANTSKLAEKVLDSTINIPPLIYQHQGGIVGIYVARDVDFSSVYELQPTAFGTQRDR